MFGHSQHPDALSLPPCFEIYSPWNPIFSSEAGTLNPFEIFLLSYSCFGDAGSPALFCEASLKTDVYSAARRFFEIDLASDGGSTQATILPVGKGTS